MFANLISIRQKFLLARKELNELIKSFKEKLYYTCMFDAVLGSDLTPCIKIDKTLMVYIFGTELLYDKS